MTEDNHYAKVWWSTEDILTLRPDWTEDQADEFLFSNAKIIQDRMIETGWGVIEDLLPAEEQS